ANHSRLPPIRLEEGGDDSRLSWQLPARASRRCGSAPAPGRASSPGGSVKPPRYFRFAAVLALSLTVALPAAQAGAMRLPPRMDAVTSGISGGALFGGTMPLLAQQGHLGRKLAIVRVYYMIGQKFNIPKVDRVMAAGTTVLASLD